MIDVRKYLHIPVKKFGRGADGLDCYGLVKFVAKTEFGITYPEILEYTGLTSEEAAKGVESNKSYFRSISKPFAGCLVLMRRGGIPCHVGIYIGSNMVMHIERPVGVTIENVTSIGCKERIEGYYVV